MAEAAIMARIFTMEVGVTATTVTTMGGLKKTTERMETRVFSAAELLFPSCLTLEQSSASCKNGTRH